MEYPERSLTVLHFAEPQLEFSYGQTTPHPKDGLFLEFASCSRDEFRERQHADLSAIVELSRLR
jgi:hypothetical protein